MGGDPFQQSNGAFEQLEKVNYSYGMFGNWSQYFIKIQKINQNLGWSILTCIGLYSMWAAKIPALSDPLFYFPTLKWGLEGFYDRFWTPIEEEVS